MLWSRTATICLVKPFAFFSLSPLLVYVRFQTTSSFVYKKTNPSMSMTNSSLTSSTTTTTTTFARNSTYPTSIHSKDQSANLNGRRCFSSIILPSLDEFELKKKSINCQTLERDMQVNDTVNISWFERCKQRFTNIFKQISKPTSNEGK